MGELDDNFTRLFGRQATDRDKQDLYAVRDVLKVKTTDSVWAFLMVLQYYRKLYEELPARIESAARDVTNNVRAAAEAEAKAAQDDTKRALMDAVRQAAVRSAEDAAGAHLVKWLTGGAVVICVALLLVGWSAFDHGYDKGKAVGESGAMKTCRALVALSSWAATPEGQLAYGLAKAGGLGDVARCSGHGMVPRDGWCTVQSDRGKALARWPLPVSNTTRSGGNP